MSIAHNKNSVTHTFYLSNMKSNTNKRKVLVDITNVDSPIVYNNNKRITTDAYK